MNMKRYRSLLAGSALIFALAAMAAAQDPKDKAAPPKDKAEKAPPAKEKSDKDAPAAKAPAVEAPKMETTALYPLNVGTKWHYKIGDNRYTLTVTKFEKIGDYNCARVEQIVDDKVTAVEHIAVTKEGVVRVAYDDKRAEPPLLFLKLPAKKGETWKVDSVVGKTEKSPGERVTGTFEEGELPRVAVPAGYNDLVITSSSKDLDANGQKLKFTYYFGKNVGMIKQEIEIGDQKVIIELERFDPAKQ
jgi:hypothetical protein